MTASEFAARVTLDTFAGVATIAVAAAWLGGWSAGAGVVGGGLLAVANFRQLVGRVLAFSASRPRRAPWLIAAAARLVVLLSAAAALMLTGWIDPIGFVVGLAVLPCAVIVEGLVTARTA
jgi:hypothetical protein